MKRIMSLIMIFSLCAGLAACGRGHSEDLTVKVNPGEIITLTDLHKDSPAVADFGLELFRESMESGENTLISPLSVLCALAMTANGAEEETLAQMESVLGLDVQTLNTWLGTYLNRLELNAEAKLSLANSIWFKDAESFTVNQDFLQTNADYYGSGVFKAPFDESTRRQINEWVEEHTGGMIRDILDEIPESVVMYLVNALAFESDWQEVYKENDIRDGEFTTENGIRQRVKMMHSAENAYLEDDMARGFLKYYEGGDYAFAALLPNPGVSVEEYLASLTGEKLLSMLENAEKTNVQATMPRFELEYDVEMSEILEAMGVERAFDGGQADFTGLGTSTEGNIYISRVLHKTFIRVDGKGTKAGAATVVEMEAECAIEPMKVEVVTLDRPFVYLLIDTHTNLPFFIGTMMDPGGEVLPEQELEGPPELTVRFGDEEITLEMSSCAWEGPEVDGKKTGFVACGARPMTPVNPGKYVDVEGETIVLSFPVMPDEVTVRRWNYSDVGSMNAPGKQLDLKELSFSAEPGEWIYEITAKWDRDTWGGEASYDLYLRN